MQRNLNPLAVHIGLAVAEMARQGALRADAALDMENMLRGIQRYQQYDADIVRPDLQQVWQAGTVTLQAVPSHEGSKAAKPVLIVPSMVNRASIMNLTQDRSMMRFFAAQGLVPYLLDWGQSHEDDGQVDFDCLLRERLMPALSFLAERHGGASVHVMGYCMGGTLAVPLAQLASEHVASLTLLAAPWDFHVQANGLRQRVQFWTPQALTMMEQKGFLDQDWLQMIFATLDPEATCRKFSRFAAIEKGSAEEALFVAIEDWLNDGVDLPSDIARMCIQDWFFYNKPAQGQWIVHGVRVDPSEIRCPVLIVASSRDHLVVQESAMALHDKVPHASVLQPDCGHIGMIAGRNAVADVWAPMAAFIDSCKA